jgi:hypothetical protein
MRTLRTLWALALVNAIIPALCAMPASATGAYRTWVSETGSDTNPCTIAQPCASFQAALAKTGIGGEINCLTPGDFSNGGVGVTITQSVSIVCDRVSNGGLLISETAGIAVTINAPSGAVVYLSGLNLNGLIADGSAGQDGVVVNSGSTVYIVHCTIHTFQYHGIFAETGMSTRVVIKDSILVNNGSGVGVASLNEADNTAIVVNSVLDGNTYRAAIAGGDNSFSANSDIAVENTVLSGSPYGLIVLQRGSTGILIGPSNTIAGAISGLTDSVPFK